MALEDTYEEIRLGNESTCSGNKTVSPAAPREKSCLHNSNCGFSKLLFVSLLILLQLLAVSFLIGIINTPPDRVWSCCPKNWKSFGSNCYFVSTESKSWGESEKNCSGMGAHLLGINSKAEQEFIIKILNPDFSYYVGLSDPEGQRHWQWVDQTPYNSSISFWHPNEPNNPDEQCVIVNFRSADQQWGWNDVHCDHPERSVCKMMEIYL